MAEIIKDLRGGYLEDPHESARELARLDDLCHKAADELESIENIRKMNIFEKMLCIQSELPTVAKNLNVDKGNGKSYKAVSERDVKDVLKPLEAKYRVYSYPVDKEIIQSEQITTTTKYGDKTQFFMRMRTVYRFVNIDQPDEHIDITGYGDGIDSGDKACGKADTYSCKYCMMSAVKLSTGDDPDQNASEEYKKIEYALPVDLVKIQKLYTPAEIDKMLKRMKKELHELTAEEAAKMIAKRDRSLIEDQSPTF